RYLRTVIVTAAVYRGFDSGLAPLLLTFRHRAGVRPYTSPHGFAEPCVFSKQSPPPGLCPRPPVARRAGPLLPKLRGQFAEFLQHRSLKRLGMLYQSTCVGFGYGSSWQGCFPGGPHEPGQSDKPGQAWSAVTTAEPWTIDQVPIDCGCRPRLRGRLARRGFALRMSPWPFGERVPHTLYRYSCHHSRFRYLQGRSREPLRRATERSATARPRRGGPAASVRGLSPGTFSARDSLFRPVSYYAFFKGWLLLSQPPGCLGRPTSFPT